MEKKIVLNVEYTMGPGGAEGFVRELTEAGILGEIRSHEGCLRYDYFKALDGDNLLLVEWWTGKEALAKHAASPCMEELKKIKEKYCSATTVEKYYL